MAVWLVVGLASALRLHLVPPPGTEAPLMFPHLLRLQLLNALPWMAAAAVAIGLARRWPVTRHDLLRPVTLHLAAALVVVPLLAVATAWLRWMAGPPGVAPSGIWESARGELARHGFGMLALYLGLVAGACLWARTDSASEEDRERA